MTIGDGNHGCRGHIKNRTPTNIHAHTPNHDDVLCQGGRQAASGQDKLFHYMARYVHIVCICHLDIRFFYASDPNEIKSNHSTRRYEPPSTFIPVHSSGGRYQSNSGWQQFAHQQPQSMSETGYLFWVLNRKASAGMAKDREHGKEL